MAYGAVFELIARIADVRPPRLRIPYPLARIIGKAGDLVEALGREPIVNSTQIRYAYTDKFRFASTKAARELGYTYGPLDTAIRDALAWFRARDML